MGTDFGCWISEQSHTLALVSRSLCAASLPLALARSLAAQGSGKSYSMVGYGEDKGIVPQAMEEMFDRIAKNKDKNIKYMVRAERDQQRLARVTAQSDRCK